MTYDNLTPILSELNSFYNFTAPTASNSSTLQGDQTAPAMNMTDYGYGGMNMTCAWLLTRFNKIEF